MKISLTDYARAAGVTYVTAYRWVKQGKLNVVREGKFVYVEQEEGRQTYNAVVYAPSQDSEINHEQVERMIDIHKVVKRRRLKSVRYFYETKADGIANFHQMLDCLSADTIVIFGVGARDRLVEYLGDAAADLVFKAVASGRKIIDMEKA